MSLAGRAALVTGGGYSVGRGYAAALAAAGMKVVVADEYDEAGKSTVAQIEEAGGEARFVHMDPTDERSTAEAVAFAAEALDGLDVLVNNLAAYGESHFRPMTQMTTAEWDRTMDVSVRGVWFVVKAAVPYLVNSDQPAIVNSTTVAAYGVSHWLDYGVARGAVIAMGKSMALELGPQGIRLNTICVGSMGMEAIALGVVDTEEQMTSTADFQRQLIPRLGTEQDVGAAVVFLADTGSSYMTGQLLVLDGGKILVS